MQALTYDQCVKNIKDTKELFSSLGFTVHMVKSVLEPTQIIRFLGFIINSSLMIVTLPSAKVENIKNLCQKLVKKEQAKIIEIASILGLLISTFSAVEYGKLYYRDIEREKILALKLSKGNFESIMEISHDIKTQLNWWIKNIETQKRDILKPNPELIMTCDASGSGWGATVKDTSLATGGRWKDNEASWHINYLELLSAYFALKSFCKSKKPIHIQILMDNTTAISYINAMGGSKSKNLDRLAYKIWEFCIERDIWLSASYLPGKQNQRADFYSRNFNDNKEWQLKPVLFKNITNIFGIPEIDIFASRKNTQLPRFVSWLPDPEAEFIDAFSISWRFNYIYAFPPFSVIGDVIRKIQQDEAEALVILPVWSTQHWFSEMLKLAIDYPIMIPPNSLQLQLKTKQEIHPIEKLRLMAVRLSGKRWKSSQFRLQLPTSSWQAGGLQLNPSMQPILKGGQIFVVEEKLIHLKKMW